MLGCGIWLWAGLVAQASVLNLSQGEAKAIHVKQSIGSVFIADPKIADYQVIERQQLVVFGKSVGTSSLLVFDKDGHTLISRMLVINKSMLQIQQKVKLHYPTLDISVSHLADQVVLSGKVATEQQKQDVEDFVGELLAKTATEKTVTLNVPGHQGYQSSQDDKDIEFMTHRHYQGIVNQLEVATTKQVNVKLTIAEVAHSFLEKFGIKIGSDGQGTGIFTDTLKHFSASDIVSVISAVGDDSVGQILAEPNLSVISGETASFLVGGELPVVTVIDGSTSVDYKEFGVRLALAAKVLRDDKIRLLLMPEVSALDTQYANETYDVPALKTRRARTTVELGDGQSFILGGLLNREETESLTKIPFIGDIPILGAIFRHTETERKKTELVIVATVNLVQPVLPEKVRLPTIQRTTTLERFFALDSIPSDDDPTRQLLRQGGFIE
jgi:pilus assembly protein CpaC